MKKQDKMINILYLLYQCSPFYAIYSAFKSLDDAASPKLYIPESLQHLDKANEYIKNKK